MGGRRLIKTAAAIAALIYCGLLAYHQAKISYNSLDIISKDETDLTAADFVTISVGEKLNSEVRNNITLDDIFISVKTTKNYEDTRLPIILKTWFQLAKEQTWFFTDKDNPIHQNLTNGHMVNTNCSDSHQRKHLCCKMSAEFDHYLKSDKRWFCHFDDDNYVNVPRLEAVLRTYNPEEEWYLGRTSIYEPIKIYRKPANKLTYSFWFATGGAGFCISQALAQRMVPVASEGKFVEICEGIRLPDDVTMGYVIAQLLQRRLTVLQEFHSHFEQLRFLEPEKFRDQISFSYSKLKDEWNVVQVPGFDTQYDPTRFLSLHCFLFPRFEFCPR